MTGPGSNNKILPSSRDQKGNQFAQHVGLISDLL